MVGARAGAEGHVECGRTSSLDFPFTSGTPIEPVALQLSRFYGGASADFGEGVAMTAAGSFAVGGYSSSATLPISTGAVQPSKASLADDGFVAVLQGCPEPPLAADDTYETGAETPLEVADPGVLANDVDPEGEPLAADLIVEAQNGSVWLAPEGGFAYDPDPGFDGVDSFVYAARDPGGLTELAVVTITVIPPLCPSCPDGVLVMFASTCACVPCPPGSEPSIDHTACVACGPGSASPDGIACEACGCGTAPAADGSACVDCPAGTSGDGIACTACAPGSAAQTGACACVTCAAGSVAGLGAAECSPCPCGSEAAVDICVTCPPGSAAPAGGACEPCAGDTWPDDGACACASCPAGSEVNADQTGCDPCPAGTASSGGGCEPCPPGEVSGPGAASCSACACGSAPSANADSCVACAAGTYADGGACQACPAGAVAAEAGACACTPCADGSVPDPAQTTCIDPCPLPGSVCDSDGDGVPDASDQCPSESAAGFDANADGCPDDVTSLADLVASLGLPAGTTASLEASARNAAAASAAGQTRAAANMLSAFVNKVEALVHGKRLHPDAAALLMTFAHNAAARL